MVEAKIQTFKESEPACPLTKCEKENECKVPGSENIIEFLHILKNILDYSEQNECAQKQCAKNKDQCALNMCKKNIAKLNMDNVVGSIFEFLKVLEILSIKVKNFEWEHEKPDINSDVILSNTHQFLKLLNILNDKMTNKKCNQSDSDGKKFDQVRENVLKFLDQIKSWNEKMEKANCKETQCKQPILCGKNELDVKQVLEKVYNFVELMRSINEKLDNPKCKCA